MAVTLPQGTRDDWLSDLSSDLGSVDAAPEAHKDLLDLALSAGRLGTWQMDLDAGTFSGSRMFWKIVGLPPTHIRAIKELASVVHPADWPKFLGEGSAPGSTGYDVEIRIEAPDKSSRWIALRGREERRDSRLIRVGVAVDLTAQRQAALLEAIARKHEYMVLELQHRLSNLFPVIIGLVNMIDARDVDEHKKALVERIRALAAVHNLLSKQPSGAGEMREIVNQELSPFQDAHNISIAGPAVMLSSGAAESFSMVVHELTTNSVKHGALKEPVGRVAVRWELIGEEANSELLFEWQESSSRAHSNGPGNGFGSSIIGAKGPPLIGHSPKLEISGNGMRYSLRLPRSALTNPSDKRV